MSMRQTWFAILITAAVSPVFGQEAPAQPAKEQPQAAAPAEKPAVAPEKGVVVRSEKQGDDVKVLRPKDVPAAMGQLKSKADIKAEVTILPTHGRAVTFKGVIRNGKLIERFMGRRFAVQHTLKDPRCGVRLWWIGGTRGWMFFAYDHIQTLALTGTLTKKERAEILRRLRAKQHDNAEQQKARREAELEANLEKMAPAELERYMLKTYPAVKGWDQKKLNLLRHRQIIENKPLTRDEGVFVKYFGVLIRARLAELKRTTKKEVIEIDHGESSQPQSQPPAGPSVPRDLPGSGD